MEISQSGEKIEGKISDIYGKATFTGTFIDSDFSFVKSYYSGKSSGTNFMYEGTFNSSENKISGRWHSPFYPSNNGAFWLNLP